MRKLLNLGAPRRASKASLVCRLASPITGLLSRPVVGLSLENKGFLGKRKKLMFFLDGMGWRANLAPLPVRNTNQPTNQPTNNMSNQVTIAEYEVTTPCGQTIIRHEYALANEIALHYGVPVVFVFSDGSRFEQI